MIAVNENDVRWRLGMDSPIPTTSRLKEALFAAAMEIASLMGTVPHPEAAYLARTMLEGLYVAAALADQASRQPSEPNTPSPDA